MEELLRVEDLTKVIDYHIIFKQLNFSLQSGKIVGLLGSNGRGKTTLLHLITGFCYPSNGKVTVDRSSISYFVEADDFYRWMRVKDALEYYEVYFEDFDRARAEQLMKEAGIDRGMKLRKLCPLQRASTGSATPLRSAKRSWCLPLRVSGTSPARVGSTSWPNWRATS